MTDILAALGAVCIAVGAFVLGGPGGLVLAAGCLLLGLALTLARRER